MGCCFLEKCLGSKKIKKDEKQDETPVKVLYKGKYGKKIVCFRDKLSHQLICCKISPISLISCRNEKSILKLLRGNLYFPQYINCVVNKTESRIYYKYIPGIDLYQYIVLNDINITDCRIISKKLLTIVSILNSYDIYHLDIKPQNILCRNGNIRDIVLIDFGLSIILKNNNVRQHNLGSGTAGFCPPEMSIDNIAHISSDCWSIGATIHYCIFKDYLSPSFYTFGIEWPSYSMKVKYIRLPKLIVSFLLSCTIWDYNIRPNVSQLLSHEWIKDIPK